jgi:hypothetical protein
LKTSQFVFAKISVFLLLLFYFLFFILERKKMNLGNNSEMGYDKGNAQTKLIAVPKVIESSYVKKQVVAIEEKKRNNVQLKHK